jgi:dTDP-glucose 4,6-dehydratase/UDP-glucuronate decarboxylase
MIGSHLCQDLLSDGHEVICADNLVTGRAENIAQLMGNDRFRFLDIDVIRRIPPLPRLDRIYHLASPASPPGYTRFPIETMRVNSEGTRRLLELAGVNRARFLYASTSEAYGDPLKHPQTEDYRGNVSSTGPRSMYDEAKRFGEALTMTYVRSRQLDGRLVRIFNTYGPRSDPADGRLVANFVTQALANHPMTIYGTGMQTRSLCYVSDLVSGLISVMETPQAKGEVINLGNPDERTVLQLAELIRELAGSTSSFVYTAPAVGDDPQMRCPDIHKAQALLDWSPHVSLREGLLDTIEYFRRVLVEVPPRVAVRVRSNGRVGALARLWSLTAGRLWG